MSSPEFIATPETNMPASNRRSRLPLLGALAMPLMPLAAQSCEPTPITCEEAVFGHSVASMIYYESPAEGEAPELVLEDGTSASVRVELNESVYPGWKAADFDQQVRAYAATPHDTDEQTIIIEGWTNEVTDGVLTPEEAAPYWDLAADLPEADLVMVKPGFTGAASANLQTGLTAARAEIDALDAAYDNVRTIDRQTVLVDHPGYMDTDGYHPNAPYKTPGEVLVEFITDGTMPTILPEARAAFQDQNTEALSDNCTAPTTPA